VSEFFKAGAVAALVGKLNEINKNRKDAQLRALWIAGEHVLSVSNEQVPFEEGDLAASGGVSQDESSGKTAISYNTDYAVKQHEDMTLKHDSGRNAKFLENALNSEIETVRLIVANGIKDGM
jgi:hypothetical protein